MFVGLRAVLIDGPYRALNTIRSEITNNATFCYDVSWVVYVIFLLTC